MPAAGASSSCVPPQCHSGLALLLTNVARPSSVHDCRGFCHYGSLAKYMWPAVGSTGPTRYQDDALCVLTVHKDAAEQAVQAIARCELCVRGYVRTYATPTSALWPLAKPAHTQRQRHRHA